ncbi:hypothetical protein CJ030_MR4G018350 [Morella rubra]|uniref:Uncharacterized protein n=1 Tax=Morella rubra TaxID=262757 RepID=A0A6A1VXI1_9ROSI|nr:hypothetical protein CJ030_MR4G018350 [Morella rubra]
MEEEKAAAYYEELTRKGEGAARFKQGLGFSSASASDNVPARGLALPSASSSFLSAFVRASSPTKAAEIQKQVQTPAERVKAKMKLQLAETAKKDATKGMGSGWERFEFNKDAPLDEEEIEAAEDDTVLVKHIGQSFRFSAVEARREEQIKAAHDEAMFGVSSLPPSINTESEPEMEDNKKESTENGVASSLLSEKVYPLFAAVGVAVGICGLQLVRNICINPEVRVNKEHRAAGVLDNFAEGEKYTEHFLRKFVRNKSPEIMPSINSFFTDPSRS